MPEVSIAAQPRTEFGKGAARRTRRAHLVPAVIYGHGTDTRHVSLPGHELMLALKGGPNTLLRVGDELVLPKAVQRDPIKGFLEHVDLVIVRRGERVTVDVPVTLIGEAAPGGLVDQQATTLSLEAEATALPSEVEVSIDGMDIGDAVHAGQVRLPGGAALIGDPEALVVHVLAAPTAEQIDAELASAEAEVGIVHEAPEGEPAPAHPQEGVGLGDIVPDTDSGAGGPGRSPAES